ncbi:MAG: hypothetical protein JNJ46_28900 [Myxococcales bacterium]|nr:hypothetical protein [Myxococcales bacterium]
MPDVLAIVSKAIFEKSARNAKVGSLWPTHAYRSANKQLEKLGSDGRLFLVTVRPTENKGEALWLVGVLERPSFDGETWSADRNRRPIVDITRLKDKLKFESGKGLGGGKGSLAMSLQTPRALTKEDATLLLAAAPLRPPREPRPPGPVNVARHEDKAPLPCLCKRCFAASRERIEVEGETYVRAKVEANERVLHFWLPAALQDELAEITSQLTERLKRRMPPWVKKEQAADDKDADGDDGDDDADDE